MDNNCLLAVMCVVLLALYPGCTAQERNQAPENVGNSAAPLAVPVPAVKRLIAIAGFENKSAYSADKLWDTCSEQLSSKLVEVGYFRVVEWDKMKRLFDWESLSTGSLLESPAQMDKARRILLCEYFIQGAVTYFDVSQHSKASALSKRKTIDTRVGVELTLQDAQTGEYICAGSGRGGVRQEFKGGLAGGQMGGWDPQAATRALTEAIEQALTVLIHRFDSLPKSQKAGSKEQKPRQSSFSGEEVVCRNGVCLVEARGISGVSGRHVDRARITALRQAYGQAVGKVMGMEIGSMTVVQNFKMISDVVTTRSQGFLKSYRIIDEGLGQQQPVYYFVTIKADVLERGKVAESETEGLRLYVDLLENPKILIVLRERDFHLGSAGNRKMVGDVGMFSLGSAETAMAQVFSRAGYETITSDDLTERDTQGLDNVGYSQRALTVARRVGADVAIAGSLQLARRSFTPRPEVEMVMVSAELSAKPILVSSGKKADIIHMSMRASHTDIVVAYSDCLSKLSQGFARKTAWGLPGILAEEVRQISLIVENVDLEMSNRIRKALHQSEVVEAATIKGIPSENTPYAEMVLTTGYLRLSPVEILEICRAKLGSAFTLVDANEHEIRIRY